MIYGQKTMMTKQVAYLGFYLCGIHPEHKDLEEG